VSRRLITLGEGPMSDEMRYPGHGLPAGAAPLPGWPKLSRGQQIGKSAILLYDAERTSIQPATIDLLSIGNRGAESTDDDAEPLILTLAPPRVIPRELDDVISEGNPQNATGEKDAYEISTQDPFPGTSAPIVWPQFEAIVEWGTGGFSTLARVDFAQGLTINLSASWLRVIAAAVPTARSGIIGTSAAYWLAAFVSPGFTRPGIAQKTIYVGDIAAGEESEVFTVPRFAKHAYVIGCDSGAVPAITIGTLRFWQSPDGQAGGQNVGNFFVSGNQPSPFPVPNAGMYFSVLSGMASSTPLAVVFDLAI
jgi:hypothetical protein